jgi:hypothetical protein
MGDMNNNPNENQDLDLNSSPNTQEENNNSDSNQMNNEYTQNVDSFTTEHQYGDTITLEPVKKKNRGKAILGFAIIAVILLGSIVAYANKGSLGNTLALLTKSPTEYYAYVEQKGLDSGIDKFTDYYKLSLDQYNKQNTTGLAQDMNLKFTVNPGFASMAGLTNFESLKANLTSQTKAGNAKAFIDLLYNDTSVISADYYMNTTDNTMYLTIPELSSAFLVFSFDELMPETGETPYPFSYNDYMANVQSVLSSEALSESGMNSLLKKYSAIIVENINKVTLEKDVAVTASNIDSNYTKITAEISEEDANNIALAILNEAKNDKVLMELFTILEITTEDEYPALIDTAIEDINANKEAISESSELLLMNLYVDGSGNIMGREFTTNNVEEATSLGYYITRNGTKFGFTGWFSENEVNVLDFTGNATYKNNSFTGDSTLSFSEYNEVYGDYATSSFNIAFEDAKMIGDKGYVNGRYTITSDLLAGASIVLACDADDNQQEIVLNVSYGGMDAASLEMIYKEVPYEEFEFPSSDIESYDGINDIYSYMATVDLESFIARLEGILGIEDLDTLLFDLMYGGMYE